MLVSKVSSKGQVTIPKEVRDCLRARPGDLIEYELQGNVAVVRRIEPFDRAFHAALSDTLIEWSSPEDEKAFRDL
jgi:antitoxin PrlF